MTAPATTTRRSGFERWDSAVVALTGVDGVVELLTVRALLRRSLRWYPWATPAVFALLVVQLVSLVRAPTVGGEVLTVLDVLVLVLVVLEPVRLRRERR